MAKLDMQWLEDFILVAESHNFTSAAQVRGVSQSQVSRNIQHLESYLNVALFERTPGWFRLTEQGNLFLKTAKSVTEQLRSAEERLKLSG